MHENLNREEEVKVSSDQSFGIVFALVFLAVGVWVVSGGQSKGWFFFRKCRPFFSCCHSTPFHFRSSQSGVGKIWTSPRSGVQSPPIRGRFFSGCHPDSSCPEAMGQGFTSS